MTWFLLFLWRKSLVEMFVVLWSVFIKFWSYKALNSAWVRHTLYIFLLILWRKNLYKNFTEFLTIFHELTKLQNFEWLTCVPTKVMSSTQMNIHNMLIITYMLTFGIFGQYLWFVMKKVHFKQELFPWPQVPLKKFE